MHGTKIVSVNCIPQAVFQYETCYFNKQVKFIKRPVTKRNINLCLLLTLFMGICSQPCLKQLYTPVIKHLRISVLQKFNQQIIPPVG